MNAQLLSSNPVAASIIEQFKNDSNNNVVQESKQTESNSKQSNRNKNVLKTTNLTESMILIDNDTGNKSGSNRTDSNPSSSESLQDLDVGDGWATITSKKKRTVRREA